MYSPGTAHQYKQARAYVTGRYRRFADCHEAITDAVFGFWKPGQSRGPEVLPVAAMFGNWNAGYMTDHSSDEKSRPLRFLTLQQVTEELNTKHSTVRTLIASGDLPPIQIGGLGQWRIERAKLEDYITAAYTKARTDIAQGASVLPGTDEVGEQ